MDSKPDYDNYSIEELEQALATLDTNAYPERAQELEQIIAARKAELTANWQAKPMAPSESGIPLAGRGQRLLAAITDSVISLIVILPVFMSLYTEEEMANPSLETNIMGLVFGVISMLVLHGYLLHYYGQTIGKRLVGIRIVDLHNQQISLSHYLYKRYLPMSLVSLIPGFGVILVGLVNPLMIFGKEQRCLHDYIAGTKVIKVSPEGD